MHAKNPIFRSQNQQNSGNSRNRIFFAYFGMFQQFNENFQIRSKIGFFGGRVAPSTSRDDPPQKKRSPKSMILTKFTREVAILRRNNLADFRIKI